MNVVKAISRVLAIATILSFMGCGEQDSSTGSARGQVAITPNSECLVHGYGYNGGCNFNYSGLGPGFTNYPTQWYNNQYQYAGWNNGFSGGFCDCPPGTRPVYNGQWGLGCVQTQQYQYNYNYMYWGWDYSSYSLSQAHLNINQTGYMNQPNNQGCYDSLSRVCDVRSTNSCGYNGSCRQIGGASTVGVCVYNY